REFQGRRMESSDWKADHQTLRCAAHSDQEKPQHWPVPPTWEGGPEAEQPVAPTASLRPAAQLLLMHSACLADRRPRRFLRHDPPPERKLKGELHQRGPLSPESLERGGP